MGAGGLNCQISWTLVFQLTGETSTTDNLIQGIPYKFILSPMNELIQDDP